MKTGPNRKYTTEFRDAAVKQVVEGRRTVAAVARSLEMSSKSLANWICAARKGEAAAKRPQAKPVSELELELELEAELSRLRHQNTKLKLEKEI